MAQRWGGIGRFNNKRYLRAVRVDNSLAGIFPPHILVTGRRARLILLKTITVEVAIFIDPRQIPFRLVPRPAVISGYAQRNNAVP
jgi:hypothetical protein